MAIPAVSLVADLAPPQIRFHHRRQLRYLAPLIHVFELDHPSSAQAQSAHTHAVPVDIASTCEPVGGERNRTVMLDLTTLVYLRRARVCRLARLAGAWRADLYPIDFKTLSRSRYAAIRSKVRRITCGIDGVDCGIRDQEGQAPALPLSQ